MSDPTISAQSASDSATRQFRYYDFVMAAFVAVLLLSNVIGAAKPAALTINGEQWVFGAGILFFPLGYVIGDVLTDVPSHQGTLTELMAWQKGLPAPRWYVRNDTKLMAALFNEQVLKEK